VVLAIHDGGFVSASVATHRRTFGHLLRAAGVATQSRGSPSSVSAEVEY